MADKLVREITPMEQDFAQWYTDIVKKAELIDYSSVRGCLFIRPYGYAIWENIVAIADKMFKQTGHENVNMPMFIPESLLQKEKDHVEGFAPEVAWVTRGGSEQLEEPLCVRPTSETLFCEHYSHIIHSWRDLPKLYNQWVSVVRWEKTTRPFLRSREFLWQEGHTAHLDEQDARAETLRMLDVYDELCRKYLCIPVIKGRKTDKEKFAGAMETYAIEAMMHDGKALQSGTTHYFGDGFARAFGIQYLDKNNKLQYVHQTSWGISTRLIGGIIMTHGDDSGLVLPPAVAPVQLVIIPIASHKPGVMDKARELEAELKAAGVRVKVDDSDQSPGWKFAQHEMKGVPIRLEIGPKDIENGQCVLVRRFDGEKLTAPLEGIAQKVLSELELISGGMLKKAEDNLRANSVTARTLDEMKSAIADRSRFVWAPWCGELACEEKIKEVTGMPSRCIPFDQPEQDPGVCPCCGKKADKWVVFAIAY